jgi:hypothetical protein
VPRKSVSWYQQRERKALTNRKRDTVNERTLEQQRDRLVEVLDEMVKIICDSFAPEKYNYTGEEMQSRELHEIPSWLEGYINWDSVAQDYEHDYWESDFGHIFRSC